jgi:hypothetical protein
VSKNFFGIIKVLHGADDVAVKSWVEVIISVLGWIGPLGFRGSGTNLESVTNHTFSSFQGGEVVVNIIISTEVWNWIVNFVSKVLLLMLELSATSGGADWIGLSVNMSISLDKGWQLVGWPVILSLIAIDLVFVNRRKDPGTITVLLNIPLTVFVLRVGNIFFGEGDVLILTEVWNKVVSWRSIWSWCGVVFVTKLGLGISDILLGVLDLRVLSEVWHKVVSWRSICSWRSVIFMTEFRLSISDVLLGVLHLSVLTEMWNEVVAWWVSWAVERCLHLMLVILFSVGQVLLGVLDLSILPEVWNIVIDWVILWVKPLWQIGIAAPWDGTWIWSILD